MKKIEILAPAGSFESVVSAVNSGADAVYLGLKNFSARKEAENFTVDELKSATSFCHIRGVKVYVTMNTLIFDDELEDALRTVKEACKCNIDALIVQDIGFASLVRKACPALSLHGSTQMSIHTLSGAKMLKEMGFKRVVLSREMSREEIKYIADNCDIELEVFVHGALCMCVSGQCYFSAMLGGRSGNRGRCAQPCRLPFKVPGCDYALSLKDNSAIYHLDDMAEIGITSAKIEGRMKRPEYVASAVASCYEKREKGYVSAETNSNLQNVFSRTGFTDGYYTGNRQDMFGYRRKENVVSATEGLFKKIRNSYKEEMQRVSLTGSFTLCLNEPPVFTVTDGENSVTVKGEVVAEKALNVPLSEEKALLQLQKTGGTPYYFAEIKTDIQEGVTVPLSSLNKIRRTALDALSEKRDKDYNYSFVEPHLHITPTYQKITERRCEVKNIEGLAFEDYDLVFVPLFTKDSDIKSLIEKHSNIGVAIPRGMFGRENAIIERVKEVKSLGVKSCLCNNLGAVYFCKNLGMELHGGEFLNLTNTFSLMWAEDYGLKDCTVSIELTDKQINSLGGNIKRGLVSYGYIPLMLTRNCPMKSGKKDCKTCKKQGKMQDRKNYEFSLFCDGNCTEVLNSVQLNILSDVNKKFSTYFTMEKFYVENYVEKVENYSENHSKTPTKPKFTNGLYFRGVK